MGSFNGRMLCDSRQVTQEREGVMVSMEEFTAYSPFDQHRCICDQGVCLLGKLEGYYEVYQYSVAGFLIELCYHSFSKRVDPLAIYKAGPCLKRYLVHITLPAML